MTVRLASKWVARFAPQFAAVADGVALERLAEQVATYQHSMTADEYRDLRWHYARAVVRLKESGVVCTPTDEAVHHDDSPFALANEVKGGPWPR